LVQFVRRVDVWGFSVLGKPAVFGISVSGVSGEVGFSGNGSRLRRNWGIKDAGAGSRDGEALDFRYVAERSNSKCWWRAKYNISNNLHEVRA
jgi:hypothetical protein